MRRDDIRNLSIAGVDDSELDLVKTLLQTWQDRLDKNLRRSMYYDGEQGFKDLGLMLPPQLKNAKFYLGWGTMAVRKAAIRSQFDGLQLPGSDDPFGLSQIFDENDFGLEFAQSTVSAYKHGVSFLTVGKGADGESAVQIQAHSAEHATALWDRRRRRISAGLTVSETDDSGPTKFNVYLPHAVLTCSKVDGVWSAVRIANRLGRTLMVPVRYDPQLGAPFGRSRITQPVMALTDMAVRAYVRMEGNAEFYSSPQVAIEGIDPEAFDGNDADRRKFKLAMDRLIALTRDEDGNAPTIKQLQQATMTPHSDMLRTVAMAFSGETGIPPSSLGIIHDNPSSAEAIRAAEHDLLIDVFYQNRFVLSSSVKQAAQLVIMVRDGLTEPPAESFGLSARFVDPEFRSLSANADAVMKLSAHPKLQNTYVPLEAIFDQDQLDRVKSDDRRQSSGSVLDRILAGREAVELEEQ